MHGYPCVRVCIVSNVRLGFTPERGCSAQRRQAGEAQRRRALKAGRDFFNSLQKEAFEHTAELLSEVQREAGPRLPCALRTSRSAACYSRGAGQTSPPLPPSPSPTPAHHSVWVS